MIWLIGAGPMAIEYAKVLEAQDKPYLCITRGEFSASIFKQQVKGAAIAGGVNSFLDGGPQAATHAIVATGIETLAEITHRLIKFGIKSILVEKPAGMSVLEIEKTIMLANEYQANVYVAYNRRFYESVNLAQKMIIEDGGVESLSYELTEWSHVIEALDIKDDVKENWFIANTSHVVDLAFFLGGKPKHLSSFTSGQTSWHKRSAIFAGSGVTQSNALFTYHGNWNAPGRWALEILTKKRRFIFSPLEALKVQQRGTVKIEDVKIENQIDKNFKPGVFLQVESFLNGKSNMLCNIKEQLANVFYYTKMANYGDQDASRIQDT
ncbi:gfo/Idh/MocA family oxidoreductase [Aliiglaciecola sp.]|nr:gfo/Idh/MocA family oxidoreductase [Aliiglaciecola sp.]